MLYLRPEQQGRYLLPDIRHIRLQVALLCPERQERADLARREGLQRKPRRLPQHRQELLRKEPTSLQR